jgi:predicted nucleic acid-binding protein
MQSTPPVDDDVREHVLLDAGVFIGALLRGDPRHEEARSIVEGARHGMVLAATTPGILSEVYGALTWERARPRHPATEAADAVRLLVEPPSAIVVLVEDRAVLLQALALAVSHGLTARRVHDARHAAAALSAGITRVLTYDADDWKAFEQDGLLITGPESTLARQRNGSQQPG